MQPFGTYDLQRARKVLGQVFVQGLNPGLLCYAESGLVLCLLPSLSLQKLQAPPVVELVQGSLNYSGGLLQRG